MESLWQADEPFSVRDVADRLGGSWAYTTLMTTLDRLYKKGLALRELRGRAFHYRPRLSRRDLGIQALRSAVSDLEAATDTRDLAVAALVDAIESRDPEWLNSLDRLVRERRRLLRRARKVREQT